MDFIETQAATYADLAPKYTAIGELFQRKCVPGARRCRR